MECLAGLLSALAATGSECVGGWVAGAALRQGGHNRGAARHSRRMV